jgi:hypothetical protein
VRPVLPTLLILLQVCGICQYSNNIETACILFAQPQVLALGLYFFIGLKDYLPNVAVMELLLVRLNVQTEPIPEHTLADHPKNLFLFIGVAVNVICVPLG